MNTTEHTPTDRTLTVRVTSLDESIDDVADQLADINCGEESEPLYWVTFQDERDLQRLLSPKHIELLRTIARESPGSIRQLARFVDRDIRQTYDNLQELETRGLVGVDQAGRAKRPSVWYDDIEIEVSIAP